jgi:pimeloyl-ACP methyl ester carboxylesterase
MSETINDKYFTAGKNIKTAILQVIIMSFFFTSCGTEKTQIRYAKFGTGEKTMVLLPGLYTKSLMPLAENVAQYYGRFLEDYTIYMFDRAENPPENYSIENMADEVLETVDSLRLKDLYVVGISMGGMIAQTLTLKRGDLVKKLFLGSSTCKATENTQKIISEWISFAQKGDEKTLNQAFAESVYTENFYKQYRKEILVSLDGATEKDLNRFAVIAGAVKDFDVSDRLNEIKCPVFCVCGALDKIIPPEMSKLSAEKTHGNFYIFDGYGHAVYDEAEDFLAKIESFFAE